MNKAQLVETIAKETDQPKDRVERILDSFIKTTKFAVRTGRDLKIKDFATFTKTKRKARIGRNPSNGKLIKLPARWVPKARWATSFREEVK